MSAVEWADFFESVSAVDAVLRADSDFGTMDFATRDRYRHAIEKTCAWFGAHRSRSCTKRNRFGEERGGRNNQ